MAIKQRQGRRTSKIDPDFGRFLEGRFPGAEIALLSDGNNSIVRVDHGKQRLAVKKVTDLDIPISYMSEVNSALASSLDVQRIVDISAGTDSFSYVISEYIDGADLAMEVVNGSLSRPELDRIVSYLQRYIEACSNLPRLYNGFGLYKVDAQKFPTHQEFLASYASKYWGRTRPFVVDRATVAWIDQWLTNGLVHTLAGERHRTVPIDSNLRNFVRKSDGSIILLNVPIVGYSTQAHAVASQAVHLRNSSLRTPFLEAAFAGMSRPERVASLELELWQLLGILSFYAMRSPDKPRMWMNWGATLPLLDDLVALVAELQSSAR